LEVIAVRYINIIPLLALVTSTIVRAEMPIYAAYVSDDLAAHCEINNCQLNTLDAQNLSSIVASLPSSLMIEDALSVSEYEVLIGNALVNINPKSLEAELVLEITTSWRKVPIDDLVLRQKTSIENTKESAKIMLAQWAQHIEQNLILEADKIYQTLGASDYSTELQVPENIGDFTRLESAVYRDPLLGSITRYTHPRFDTAVVDISVYPYSPFLKSATTQKTQQDYVRSGSDWLQLEMENEITQIKELIEQANIEDYSISSVQAAEIIVDGKPLEGFRLEVLLHTQTDPVYSTQYVFQQNDKIIKLTGNLPEFLMSALVAESMSQIKVPNESSFMRSLRQG
jgi:hypothetical protein